MPSSYAITRSVFFVDVRFEGKFERGHFRFFSFKKKKDLYIYGKKTQDYDCVRPDFIGRFTKGYVVNEDEYRRCKHKDMVDSEKEVKKLDEQQIKQKYYNQLREKLPQLTQETLSEAFGISRVTAWRWENNKELLDSAEIEVNATGLQYINNSKVSDNDLIEQEVV
jgi:DNA-binding transcriptional regulator YiaG